VLNSGNAGNLNLNVPIALVSYVNDVSDAEKIAENFATHFANTCTSNTITGANRLKNEYSRLRRNYHFQPLNDRRDFDAE